MTATAFDWSSIARACKTPPKFRAGLNRYGFGSVFEAERAHHFVCVRDEVVVRNAGAVDRGRIREFGLAARQFFSRDLRVIRHVRERKLDGVFGVLDGHTTVVNGLESKVAHTVTTIVFQRQVDIGQGDVTRNATDALEFHRAGVRSSGAARVTAEGQCGFPTLRAIELE
jgi:hypothetical protein